MSHKQGQHRQKRLKVALVTKSRGIGGAEKNMMDFFAGVDRDRFECALVGLRPTDLVARATALGVDTHVTQTFLPVKIRDLHRFLGQWHPDILHLFGLEANLLGRLLRPFHHPRMVTALLNAEPHPPAYYRLLNRATVPPTNYWIANSEAGKALTMAQIGARSDRIYIVRNGIDVDHFLPPVDKAAAKRHLGLDPLVSVIVEVANLRPMKGHLDVVQAIPEVIRRAGQTVFIFVGGDHMGGVVQEQVRQRGLDQYVTFAGKHDDVRPFLAAADVFTLPSHHEGLPTSIMEAMAMQLPVVATRVGGIPEMVADGTTGLLVEPNDPRGLGDALVSLLMDGPERLRLGHNARRSVIQCFSVGQMIESLESAYSDIASGT